MFVDGVSVPLLRRAPFSYLNNLFNLLKRLVRFMFSLEVPQINENILLFDVYTTFTIEFERIFAISNKLARNAVNDLESSGTLGTVPLGISKRSVDGVSANKHETIEKIFSFQQPQEIKDLLCSLEESNRLELPLQLEDCISLDEYSWCRFLTNDQHITESELIDNSWRCIYLLEQMETSGREICNYFSKTKKACELLRIIRLTMDRMR